MIKQLTHKTTRPHYKFYSNLSAQVSDNEIRKFLNKNRLNNQKLRRLFRNDPFLRNIDFKIFDRNIHSATFCEPDLLELINACLWKWVLIYRVLAAKPIFVGTLYELVH